MESFSTKKHGIQNLRVNPRRCLICEDILRPSDPTKIARIKFDNHTEIAKVHEYDCRSPKESA